MDMVMNARSPADLEHVYALTVTLLQYRADPNVHIATTEPMICHSQSSVFLKKSSHQVLYYYVQVIMFTNPTNQPERLQRLLEFHLQVILTLNWKKKTEKIKIETFKG